MEGPQVAPRCRIMPPKWGFYSILSKEKGGGGREEEDYNKKNKVTPADYFHI